MQDNKIEAWLSLVERRVRDAEAASSNLVASIKTEAVASLLHGPADIHSAGVYQEIIVVS